MATYTKEALQVAVRAGYYDHVPGLFYPLSNINQYAFSNWAFKATDADLAELKENLGENAPPWLKQVNDIVGLRAMVLYLNDFIGKLDKEDSLLDFMFDYMELREATAGLRQEVKITMSPIVGYRINRRGKG